MSYGFKSYNTSGELIVADDHTSFHYLGDATKTAEETGVNNFTDYTSALSDYQSAADTSLDGRVIYTYTITTTSTNPLVFIKPTDYSKFHGLIEQSVSGTTWTFKVIKNSTQGTNAPILKVFVEADAIPNPSPGYGMILKNASNEVTFDSEKQPLAITAAGVTKPPSQPCNGGAPHWNGNEVASPFVTSSGSGNLNVFWAYPWNDHDLYHDFGSDEKYRTTKMTGLAYNTSNLMFASPSIAQSVQSRIKYGSKYSQGQDHNSTALWWAMYLNAFRFRDAGSGNTYFDSGWAVYAAGYDFSSVWEDGGTFGGGGGTIALGTRPYSDKTINLVDNGFLIADASRY
jgi:hypothetical protein